jgi:hypothetical protein
MVVRKNKLENVLSYELENGQQSTNKTRNTWQVKGREDASLLVICIYLVTITDKDMTRDGNMFCSLYEATKRSFAALSCLSLPTMELIQSGALLTLFEFGHGRARFAYRTLSETFAMARTAGIQPGFFTRDSQQETLDNTEEDRGAIWWALFILDQ